MREWWLGLERRERRLLAGGALFLLAVGYYVLLWSPLAERHQRLEQSHAESVELLAWLESARDRLQARRGETAGATGPSRAGVSPMLAVEQSARGHEVLEAVKSRRPDGERAVEVVLEDAAFDRLPAWLAELEGRYGLSVQRLRVEPRDVPGRVDARIRLEREA